MTKIDNFLSLASQPKVFGPYYKAKDSKRQIVIIIDEHGNRKTMSYPKFLYEQYVGHPIGDLTVDHINFDHSDNRPENLRAIPRDFHSAEDTRRVQLIKLKCQQCGKDFERSPRHLRDKSKKGARGFFCSRNCSATYNRAVQLGKAKKLPVQPFIESSYYRRKNIQATFDFLIAKYS